MIARAIYLLKIRYKSCSERQVAKHASPPCLPSSFTCWPLHHERGIGQYWCGQHTVACTHLPKVTHFDQRVRRVGRGTEQHLRGMDMMSLQAIGNAELRWQEPCKLEVCDAIHKRVRVWNRNVNVLLHPAVAACRGEGLPACAGPN